jgi:hypothetical protein
MQSVESDPVSARLLFERRTALRCTALRCTALRCTVPFDALIR